MIKSNIKTMFMEISMVLIGSWLNIENVMRTNAKYINEGRFNRNNENASSTSLGFFLVIPVFISGQKLSTTREMVPENHRDFWENNWLKDSGDLV